MDPKSLYHWAPDCCLNPILLILTRKKADVIMMLSGRGRRLIWSTLKALWYRLLRLAAPRMAILFKMHQVWNLNKTLAPPIRWYVYGYYVTDVREDITKMCRADPAASSARQVRACLRRGPRRAPRVRIKEARFRGALARTPAPE